MAAPDPEEPTGSIATGSVGMKGELFAQVIRAHPSLRRRIADAISNFIRRHRPL